MECSPFFELANIPEGNPLRHALDASQTASWTTSQLPTRPPAAGTCNAFRTGGGQEATHSRKHRRRERYAPLASTSSRACVALAFAAHPRAPLNAA